MVVVSPTNERRCTGFNHFVRSWAARTVVHCDALSTMHCQFDALSMMHVFILMLQKGILMMNSAIRVQCDSALWRPTFNVHFLTIRLLWCTTMDYNDAVQWCSARMRYTVWTRGSFVTPQISDPARVSEMQLVGLQEGGVLWWRCLLFFYLVFLSHAPDICVCLYFFHFLLSRYSEPISGVY